MSNNLNKDQGDAHEQFIAELVGGIQHPGSGNQWARPIDGDRSRYESRYNFAWDCKSTRNLSTVISRKMWEKAREQSGGNRTAVPIRFQERERPTVDNRDGLDLVLISAHDWAELIEAARKSQTFKADFAQAIKDYWHRNPAGQSYRGFAERVNGLLQLIDTWLAT